MIAVVSGLIFAGSFGVAMATIVAMVVPQWDRIVSLMAGQRETAFAPLSALVQAERRIAVRRWAVSERSGLRSLREAA